MKISTRMIDRYLVMLTEARPALLGDPLHDLSEYDSSIDSMGALARAQGDEAALRLAIDALVAAPEGRLSQFAGSVYRWPNAEFVQLLTYAFERLWPLRSLSMPGSEPQVELVRMTDEEWAAYTGRG
jgi:hypothetical protein